MFNTTEKQRRAAGNFLSEGGTVHTVIIHDTGTSMRIIQATGGYSMIDVDHSFQPNPDGSLGETIMDLIRLDLRDQKEYLTTTDD